jgi:hypothetical protein
MISNERLEELRCAYLSFANGMESGPIGPPTVFEIRDMIEELQRYRQAATAGVDEAAERLYDAVAQVSIGGSYSVPYRLAVPVIREYLAALLAERDAALNEISVVWSRVALLSSQIPPKVFEELNAAAQIVERVLKTGELQPTIAEYRAVLRECRVKRARFAASSSECRAWNVSLS